MSRTVYPSSKAQEAQKVKKIQKVQKVQNVRKVKKLKKSIYEIQPIFLRYSHTSAISFFLFVRRVVSVY